MCGACFTSLEAIALCSAGAWSAVTEGRRARRLARRGLDAGARAALRWDEAATLLATMGHDPARVLGPRPGARSPSPAGPPASPISAPAPTPAPPRDEERAEPALAGTPA